MSRKPQPVQNRILRRVDTTDPGKCWIWQGTPGPKGYGSVNRGTRSEGTVYIHRAIYEALVGPLNSADQLDHVCHTEALTAGTCAGGPTCVHRRCVNPAHLEPVSGHENLLRGNTLPGINARKTHCTRGHPYSGENLIRRSNGKRECRACRRIYRQQSQERRAEGGGANALPRHSVGA